MKFKLRKMQNYVKQLEGKGFIHFLLPNVSFIRKSKFWIFLAFIIKYCKIIWLHIP